MSTTAAGETLGELLVKIGYSRYALKAEVITEEMLDEMRATSCTPNPERCADGKPFDAKPALVASCN